MAFGRLSKAPAAHRVINLERLRDTDFAPGCNEDPAKQVQGQDTGKQAGASPWQAERVSRKSEVALRGSDASAGQLRAFAGRSCHTLYGQACGKRLVSGSEEGGMHRWMGGWVGVELMKRRVLRLRCCIFRPSRHPRGGALLVLAETGVYGRARLLSLWALTQ